MGVDHKNIRSSGLCAMGSWGVGGRFSEEVGLAFQAIPPWPCYGVLLVPASKDGRVGRVESAAGREGRDRH